MLTNRPRCREVPRLLYQFIDSVPGFPKLRRSITRFARAAWARVIPAELLHELLMTTHDSIAAFDMSLRREALSPFATDLESTRIPGARSLFA
jgi:hypothetical protein